MVSEYEVIDDYVYYIFEDSEGYNILYKDITNEWLNKSNPKVKEARYAKYVIKNGKSMATFYHTLQNKDKQAGIFLIDCTDSNFTDKEIYDDINYVFKSMRKIF